MARGPGGGENEPGEDLGSQPPLIDFCEHVAESLSAFLEGEGADVSVSGLDRKSIEAHLAVCTYCGSLRPKTSAMPRNGPIPAPPPRVWEGIESILREEGLVRD